MIGRPVKAGRASPSTTHGGGRTPGKRAAAAGLASDRHPAAAYPVLRFTDAANADLEQVVGKGDPQVVKWALKKWPAPRARLRGR